jgi:hypothetical protein
MTALAAQFGGQAEPQQPGFFGSLIESVTGSRRSAAPDVQAALAEGRTIYDMPETNQMSFGLLKSALGGLMAGSEERAQIFVANFPGMTYRKDDQGTVFMRSPTDGKEYVIEPGLTTQDAPRIAASLAAFTPAGRATTIPGAVAAGAATQAAIEATQAGTGGRFDTADVALAGAGGGAGQVVQRTVQAAIPPVKQAVQRVTGRTPAPAAPVAAAPVRAPVPDEGVTVTPATSGQPVTPAAPAAATAAPGAAPVATEAFEEVGELVRKASGSGPGSATAKAKLADLAQVNTEARAAADRLGMDLPFDVFSDNPQVRAAVGLTRSLAGGEAEAAWVNTVRTAIGKADDVVQQFDAAFIEGRPAPGATSQRILDSLTNTRTQIAADASNLYKQVDAVVPAAYPAETKNLQEVLDAIRRDQPRTASKNAALRSLEEMAKDGMTYGDVSFEKSMLGATKRAATPNIYSTNLNVGIIKRLEAALAKDQLDTVEAFGGEEVRRQLRAANLLTAKKGALDKRIIGAFGKEADGSVATLMQSAIKSAAKGDAAQFNKLMKVVPPELRKETVATALASVSSSGRAGQEGAFGFAEFAKTYRGLRANPPVYKQVIEVLGKDADPVLRDLFEISRRITDARAQVLTTGKANQALVEAMKAEGLLGTIMQSTMAQRAVTGAAGLMPGGGLVAPDIVKFMSQGNTEAVKAAGKLFASDEFQKLAIDAATKPEVSQAVLRRAAMSKAFGDFATAAKLPQSLDARVQFLQSAIQTERQFDQENQ